MRLLRYLVEQEQAGAIEQLREVQIGCAFYRRDEAYDPKLDAVVRVNATRLRARLEEHYATHRSSKIRIVLPKGSYVPRYVRQEDPPAAEAGTALLPEPVAVPATAANPVRWTGPDRRATSRTQAGRRKTLWLGPMAAAVMTVAALGWAAWRLHTAGLARAGTMAWMARPLSRMGGMEQFPEFSPDGKSVVFAWPKSEKRPSALYMQDVWSDVPHVLTGKAREETRAAWSHDGRKLAFLVPDGNSTKRVVVRDMRGGAETEVATLRGSAPWLCRVPKLSWGPGDREIFTSAAPTSQAGERCGIVAIEVGRHTTRVVTRSPQDTLGDVEAAPSPDGKSVAFLRAVSYGVVDVYLVDPQGGTPTRATFDNREIMGLTWAPEGKNLLLGARGEDGTVRLTERNLKTGSVTMLTDGTAPAAFPAIAGSSRAIVFTSYRSTANLYRASSAGNAELIVDQSLKSVPQLSPDGKHLAYTSDRTGFAEVWISDADGRNGLRLTNTGGTGAQHPFWLPDGKSVLFECRDLQHSQICLTQAAGRGPIQRLTHTESDQVLPSLSRDGRFLYYSSNRTGRWKAYRQMMPQGEPVQLTSGGTIRVMESWDGKSIYLETEKAGGGFLIAPVDRGMVDTSVGAQADRAYVREELRQLQTSAWNAGPGGIVFCRRTGTVNVMTSYDDRTRRFKALEQLPGEDEVDTLSVGADAKEIVYGTRPRRTGEIDLLAPVNATAGRS